MSDLHIATDAPAIKKQKLEDSSVETVFQKTAQGQTRKNKKLKPGIICNRTEFWDWNNISDTFKIDRCPQKWQVNRGMDINSNYSVNLVKKKSPLAKENQVETFGETSYFHEDGLRKVKPYYFTHHTFAKFGFHK